jgi:hypothetical protein
VRKGVYRRRKLVEHGRSDGVPGVAEPPDPVGLVTMFRHSLALLTDDPRDSNSAHIQWRYEPAAVNNV